MWGRLGVLLWSRCAGGQLPKAGDPLLNGLGLKLGDMCWPHTTDVKAMILCLQFREGTNLEVARPDFAGIKARGKRCVN